MFKPTGLYGHICRNTALSVLFLLGLPLTIELLQLLWMVPIQYAVEVPFADVANKLGMKNYPEPDIANAADKTIATRYGRGWWLFFFNIAATIALTLLFARYFIRSKTGATGVARGDEPRLYNIVENLSITAGLPMPQVEIVESPRMNAFATGFGPGWSSITVSRGLLNQLGDAELEAVIAHELTHIKNHDSKFMTIAGTLVSVITGIWTIIWRFVTFPTPFKLFILFAMLPVALGALAAVAFIGFLAIVSGMALRMSLSHSREFMADAGAVELTKNPEALISALRKISGNQDITDDESLQAMMFCGTVGGWFDSHPPLEDRVMALVSYAGARDLSSEQNVGSSPHRQPSAPVVAPATPHFGKRQIRPTSI